MEDYKQNCAGVTSDKPSSAELEMMDWDGISENIWTVLEMTGNS